jgi:TrmH family RNA methyltransferase
MVRRLESIRNPFVKFLQSLESKSKDRRKAGLFLIEGIRELQLAAKNHFIINQVVFCPEYISPIEVSEETGLSLNGQTEWIEVTEEVSDKLFYRKGIRNVLGVCRVKTYDIKNFKPKGNPLILIIEKVEKPGNLGAMLRTADAAGVNAVVICDSATDIFNPNVVRNSLGCLFSIPVVISNNEEVFCWLKAMGIKSFAAHLGARKLHYEENFAGPTAIVMGSEATGLSEAWEQNADAMIKIPMLGQHDSMNVANAAAVILYEAVRQRMYP